MRASQRRVLKYFGALTKAPWLQSRHRRITRLGVDIRKGAEDKYWHDMQVGGGVPLCLNPNFPFIYFLIF